MIALLPLIIPWLIGAAFLLVDGARPWAARVAALVLLLVFGIDCALLFEMSSGYRAALEVITGGWPQGVGIRLYVDRLALLFGAVSAAVLAAVLWHEGRAGVRSRLFPALILLMASGLHGAFFTGDLFNFYVFFELSVVCSFALAAYGYGRPEVRGAFIYVAVNLFGSVLFLIGVATLYHATGTLDYEQLAERAGPGSGVIPASALLFVALSIKLGLFPFHGWVPVLYSHARPAVVAALSGALVNIGAYGLLRLGSSPLELARQQGQAVLLVLGVLAVLYGSALAVRRTRAAEVAAYISIVHAGFVVLALGIGGAHGTTALLLVVLSGSLDKSSMFLSLETERPLRAKVALIAGASVAGIPITVGFLSKVQVMRAALEAPAAWLIVGGVLTGMVLIIAAAIRFWRMVPRIEPAHPAPGWPAAVLATTIVALGVAAEGLTRLCWTISLDVLGGSS